MVAKWLKRSAFSWGTLYLASRFLRVCICVCVCYVSVWLYVYIHTHIRRFCLQYANTCSCIILIKSWIDTSAVEQLQLLSSLRATLFWHLFYTFHPQMSKAWSARDPCPFAALIRDDSLIKVTAPNCCLAASEVNTTNQLRETPQALGSCATGIGLMTFDTFCLFLFWHMGVVTSLITLP